MNVVSTSPLVRPTKERVKHLTPKELADRESVPLQTVYKWNSEGTGPTYIRAGRHVRYRLPDVESWEDSRSSGGGNAA